MELNKAGLLAEDLMKQYGLSNWRFIFDSAVSRFGQCSLARKTISLSKALTMLNSEEDVKDTILHEIAHALEYIRYKTVSHGPVWKKIAIEVGCVAKRCYDPHKIVSPTIPKYVYKCPKCNRTRTQTYQNRQSVACGVCCNKYNKGFFSEKYMLELLLTVKV